MFDLLSEGTWGFVVMVDNSDRESFDEAQKVPRQFDGLPAVRRVIAASKQHLEGAVSPEELRKALILQPSVRILPCIATDPASVRSVVPGLLCCISEEKKTRSAGRPPSRLITQIGKTIDSADAVCHRKRGIRSLWTPNA